MRSWAVGLTVVALLMLATATAAIAVGPSLLSVSQNNRHPAATFSLPGADSATIYFATRPDRATDGSFLSENIAASDFLRDDEIAAGIWSYEEQLDPGLYYVLLHASDYDCIGESNPSCIDGYSAVTQLSIPKPVTRYSSKVTVYRYLGEADLKLTARPLGEDVPYRVCWTAKNNRRKCLRSTLDGYSWQDDASDSVSVGLRGLRTRTTFAWYVGGRKVASKRIKAKPA